MFKFLGFSTILACSAFAQGVSAPGTRAAAASSNGSEHFAAIAFLVTVPGAPYSADEVSEITPPGAATQTALVVHVYRDSSGRTRVERPFSWGAVGSGSSESPSVVEISDPVAGVRYTLDTQAKVAHKQVLRSLASLAAPGGRPDARPSAVPVMNLPPPPPPPPGGSGAPSLAGGAPPMPGAPNGKSPQVETAAESLGTRTIEGVKAEGTLRRTTVPAGIQGNTEPVVMTSESWFSPDLKVALLSKETDPRSGEQIRRLTHVNRGEPAAALFTPPADYTVVEESADFTIQARQKL